MNKHDVVVQAIQTMKEGQYKLTGIKIELEAQMNRGNSDRNTCYECDGDWEGESCYSCDDGWTGCSYCDDGEVIENDEPVTCGNCEGSGRVLCDDCDGDGYLANCEYCDEGYTEGDETSFGSTTYCQQWILERLAPLGLAEKDDNDEYKPKHPLVYARFYNDGSVDSELTYTLSLDDPKNVLLLPAISDVFKELADEIGEGMDVSGAGMHITLIKDSNCEYPSKESQEGTRDRLDNFYKNMQMLIPALYFLGTSDDKTRGLRYRAPKISTGQDMFDNGKYSAIVYRGRSLEFRVFDTCYDNPEAVFDNIVVIKNAMKFWTMQPIKHSLTKLSKRVRFGVDNSDELSRLYITEEHVELLNRGLRILKPSYYTVTELKKQRKFSVTKRHAKARERKAELNATIEYKEYENRFSWSVLVRESSRRYNLLERQGQDGSATSLLENKEIVLKEIEESVKKDVQEYEKTKLCLTDYVKQRMDTFHRQTVGEWELG